MSLPGKEEIITVRPQPERQPERFIEVEPFPEPEILPAEPAPVTPEKVPA